MKIIKYALCAFLFGGLVSACNFLDKEPYKLSPEKYFNKGKVLIAAANPEIMENYIEKGDLVILGNRYESQLCAIEMGAECIIVCEGADVSSTIKKIAEQNDCTIIGSHHDTYTVARLNETMINGARQIGTTSADQVESLNESPMSSIRMIQKNFKNFLVEVGNKILKLIQEYYTENRIIEIASGLKVDDIIYKYVEMGVNEQNEKVINFYQELGKEI